MKRLFPKGVFLPFLFVLLGGSIAIGAYVTTTGGGLFELRKKAMSPPPPPPQALGARLYLKGPSQVKTGEQFSFELVLDTTNDLKYTVSGVDARIAVRDYKATVQSTGSGTSILPQDILLLTKVTPGTIFDSYPGLLESTSGLRPADNIVTISGVKNYAADEKGRFKGFSGVGAVATLTFVAQRPGTATLQFVYTNPTATDDTNVTGLLLDQPASLQKPQERLIASPAFYSIDVVTSGTPTPTPVTCVPEPPCVYEGALDSKGNRVYCSPRPLLTGQKYCPRPTRTPTPTVVLPTPNPCSPRPSCLDIPPYCKLAVPEGGWCPVLPTPRPTCTQVPPCMYEGVSDPNDPSKRVFCAVDLEPGGWWCPRSTPPPPTPTPTVSPTPTPTPTPEPRVMINFRLQLEGRKNHATVVDIYGMTTTTTKPSPELIRMMQFDPNTAPAQGNRLDKLGTTVTDLFGTGVISLDRTYAGTSYMLFAQTPSHLRKAAQNYQGIRLDVGQNPVCRREICTTEFKYVDFGTLTAGDVYTDEKGNKDNLINTFDVGAVFTAWSGADVVAMPRDTSSFGGILPKEVGRAGDLNGDGVVNNRDLAILLINFNKRGDTTVPPSETIKPLPVSTIAPQ